MVITVDSLNLQVKALQDQYGKMLESFSNNIINFALQYQNNLQNVKANIDFLHKQIGELVKEEQKSEKEKKTPEEVIKKK